MKCFRKFSIILIIKDAQDIELYQARLFCSILVFFNFGFGKRILMVNGIKETGRFRISRFRSLSSKLTFLSVIIDIIIPYFSI